jgi:ABC-type dipeptide/oligopeptide/nickel transport system permease component
MLVYFARRIVDGVATLFFAGLVIYSLILYFPSGIMSPGPRPYSESCCSSTEARKRADEIGQQMTQQWARTWEIDKPWPVNYVAWLFDPTETIETSVTWHGTSFEGGYYELFVVPKGVKLTLWDLHVAGSGVLTGDLGRSVSIEPDQPVADVFEEGFGEFMLLMPLALFAAMAFVFVQRRRRPPVPGLSNYPKTRYLLPQYMRPMRVPGL